MAGDAHRSAAGGSWSESQIYLAGQADKITELLHGFLLSCSSINLKSKGKGDFQKEELNPCLHWKSSMSPQNDCGLCISEDTPVHSC